MTERPYRRLSPLTPLARSLVAFVAAGTYAANQLLRGEIGALTIAVLAVIVGGGAVGAASWFLTKFWIESDELRIDTGVLNRQSRRIRIDRLQGIDIVQPLGARLFGLAELRMDVAGGTAREGSLAFLRLDEARELKDQLLARRDALRGRRGTTQAAGPATTAAPPSPERVLARVPPGRLLASLLLSTQTLGIVFFFAWPALLATIGAGPTGGVFALPVLASVAFMVYGQYSANHGFTVSETEAGVQARRGLLNLTSQTIALHRVQGVVIREPVIWRIFGWARLDVSVAGGGAISGDEAAQVSTALPVGDRELVRRLASYLLGGPDPDSVTLTGVPRKAHWFAPVGAFYLAAGATDELVVARLGWLTRRTHVVAQARVQSVRILQGPLQRLAGVASVHLDSPPGPVHAAVLHRSEDEARRILETEVEVTRAARERAAGGPTLSVVVPVYGVEAYLSDCLESIRRQPFRDFEVVIVDDGSPDASAEIAQRFVERDRRFRLVRQDNAGLGAARNTGVTHCRGDLLTFVDSDDMLPDDAWSRMVATLRRTGSDFAVGALKRDDGERVWATPRMRDNHRVDRLGITVEEMPEILADVFAVNKIFRRDFWDRAGIAFPVGVRYEDQPTLTRVFFAAERFDVLTDTVYHWSVRHASITQRRNEMADLEDRFTTKRDSTSVVLAHGSERLCEVWFADVLPLDMATYFRQVPGCGDDYWRLLREMVLELWGPVPFERTRMPVQQRMMGWLVAQDRRADLERLIEFVDAHPSGVPVRVSRDRVVALLPGWDDPAVPREVVELGDHELRWDARLQRAEWQPGRLLLEGFALIRHVPTGGADTALWMWLEGPSGERRDVLVMQRPEPRATAVVRRPEGEDYDECGFAAVVDLTALGPGEWRFRMTRKVGEINGGGGFTGWAPGVARGEVQQLWPGAQGRVVDAGGEPVLVLEAIAPERAPAPAAARRPTW